MASHREIYGNPTKPGVIKPDFDRIPQSMRDTGRWILWRLEWREAWSKVPYAVAGHRCSTTNASHWSDFESVRDAYIAGGYDGIGFVLGDGWAGIDLDDCRTEDGTIAKWAKQILRAAKSYSEISPSGTGVKIFGRGAIATAHNKFACENGTVEVYDNARYFCVTGSEGCGEPGDLTGILNRIACKLAPTSSAVALRRNFAAATQRKAVAVQEPDTPEYHRAKANAYARLIQEWYGETVA